MIMYFLPLFFYFPLFYSCQPDDVQQKKNNQNMNPNRLNCSENKNNGNDNLLISCHMEIKTKKKELKPVHLYLQSRQSGEAVHRFERNADKIVELLSACSLSLPKAYQLPISNVMFFQ